MKTKLQINEISKDYYNPKAIPFAKYSLISLVIMFFAFAANFPVKEIIISQVKSAISMNRSCPLLYKDIDVSFFLPKVIIKSPIISSRCFKGKSDSLALKDLKLSLHSPSLSPLGVRFKTVISPLKGKDKIILYPVVGLGSFAVKIEDTKLTGKFLSDIAGQSGLLKGDLNIESLLKLEGKKLEDLNLQIISKNLQIPTQTVQGLVVPNLDIKNFKLNAKSVSSKEVRITNLILGDKDSPIITDFKGKLILNKYNIMLSTIDVTGDVKFSQSFMNSFPILGLLMSSAKKNEQGFYKIRITGKLNRLNKPQFL